MLCKDEFHYYEGYKFFCYQNCIQLLLSIMDVHYAPLFINASLSLILKEDMYSDYKYTICFHDNSRDVLPEFAYMLQEHKYRFGMTEEVFEINRKKIKNENKAIITTLDVFYLPYHYLYEREHGSHTVLLADCTEESVKIIDWYPPSFYFGELSTTDFKKARGSINPMDEGLCSGDPIRNFWSEIEIKDLNIKPKTLLNMMLDLTVKQQYEQSINLQGTSAWIAIYYWLVQIEKDSLETRRNIIQYLYKELLPAFKRYLFFKQYLKLYMDFTEADSTVFEPVISMLNQCIERWDILHTLMMKFIYMKVNSDAIYEKILNHFRKHLELEYTLKEKIIALKDHINR